MRAPRSLPRSIVTLAIAVAARCGGGGPASPQRAEAAAGHARAGAAP